MEPIARAALDDAGAELLTAELRPLPFAPTTPTSAGIYRCAGLARTGRGVLQPWSAILKITQSLADFPPLQAVAPALREQVLAQWVWDREGLVYQSGLLDHLPVGLRAPRCYRVQRPSADRLWLWLEDLGVEADPWTSDDFARAACAIGQLNGSHVGNIPDVAWLARDFLRWYVELGVGGHHLPLLTDPQSWAHPLVRRAFPPRLVARLLLLWNRRGLLLDALDRLPRTLCHGDACRANLPQRRGPDGRLQVVALDWANVGVGAIGEDVGHLLASAVVYSREVEPPQAERFTEVILASYIAGLRSAGWRGSETQARLGCLLTAALRWAFSAPQVAVRPATWDAATRPQRRPVAEVLEREAAALGWLLDLADAAARTLG